MENQASNGRVSRFDAIRLTDEEEVPQDLNEEREVDIIFYKEEEITYISRKNKSKAKGLMFKWEPQNILILIKKHSCIM